jgi:starch phosphorylase
MPEALETWPVALVEHVLPRHVEIILEINRRFLEEVRHRFPGEDAMVVRMSIIDEGNGRRVRMAHLAVVGSHRVNGVSALHTELMRASIFADFHRENPAKIINITNGITPRRWLNQANARLSAAITERIGDGWLKDLDQLQELIPLAGDAAFQAAVRAAKRANKADLARRIERETGLRVDPHTLFDVQVKRIHEYKRQTLNLLHVISRYNRLRDGADLAPRTVLFSGKAAPGYARAKQIIRLIHGVAEVVNHDPATHGRLRVAFLPNYNVTNAGWIIKAADLSEQISTAGTEASGTGNMKLALNGALTIGTLDGANIEIRDQVGDRNFFAFGLTTEEVARLHAEGYDPRRFLQAEPELARALDMIADGYFSPGERGLYHDLVHELRHHDPYLLCADYASYVACQAKVDAVHADPRDWTCRAILNVANMGRFSADRTIREYAGQVWGVRVRDAETRLAPTAAPDVAIAHRRSRHGERAARRPKAA